MEAVQPRLLISKKNSVSCTKIDRKIHLFRQFWDFSFGSKDPLWVKDKPTGTFCFAVVIDATVRTVNTNPTCPLIIVHLERV
jgi:hypothetical protein